GAPRDDVDDPADRVGTEQRRTRALHDLDTFDNLRCDVLDCGSADGAGIDAHAVDQDQRVVTFRSTQEHRSRLPGSAVPANIESGLEAQQLRQVRRHRLFDILPGNHVYGNDRLGNRYRRAGCRDDYVVLRLRAFSAGRG